MLPAEELPAAEGLSCAPATHLLITPTAPPSKRLRTARPPETRTVAQLAQPPSRERAPRKHSAQPACSALSARSACSPALALILGVQRLKLLAPAVSQAGGLVGAEQRPLAVGLPRGQGGAGGFAGGLRTERGQREAGQRLGSSWQTRQGRERGEGMLGRGWQAG